MARPQADRIERVACVGGGTIGAGWAAVFLAAGKEVTMSDPAPGAEGRARAIVDQAWPWLERLGLAPGACRQRLRFVASPEEAVARAQFVQESAPDREDLKIALFARIDAACPTWTVLASSSSSFLPTRLQSQCRHPQRVVIGHPFAPSYLLPLVEVVGGQATDPAVMDWACAFYDSIGRRPLRLKKEIEAYIANRLQHVVFDEAASLVEQGICDWRDIDTAVACGPGLRWAFAGPATCYHLGGGKGGVTHMIDHFGWTRGEEARRRLIGEVEAMYGHLTMDALERWRDENLVTLLTGLKPPPEG